MPNLDFSICFIYIYARTGFSANISLENRTPAKVTKEPEPGEGGGGNNYYICWYAMCHILGAFFRAENQFWDVIFGEITCHVDINFGVSI